MNELERATYDAQAAQTELIEAQNAAIALGLAFGMTVCEIAGHREQIAAQQLLHELQPIPVRRQRRTRGRHR